MIFLIKILFNIFCVKSSFENSNYGIEYYLLFFYLERKWAPTMMKIDEDEPGTGTQHFFLEILRTKHGGKYTGVFTFL